MTRKPAVSGMFYEREFEKLNKQIKECFHSPFGPGKLPEKKSKEKIKAVIVPHAGYSYSGGCAAFAYKKIAESEWPDTFIIIGPNHTGMGYNSVLMDNMSTPFGDVKLDVKLAREIIDNTSLVDNSEAHLREHSIEVQLPFLQFIAKKNELKIVPIVIGECDFKKIGIELKKIISKKNVCVIVSSDFIHHGINYGYYKFHENVSKNVKEQDNLAYKFIKEKDVDGFANFIMETGSTICGMFPILLMMSCLDYEKTELLKHYSSSDISKDESICVDYLSIIIK